MPTTVDLPCGSHALRDAAAWADLPARGAVVARGVDAVKFVDGFATAALGAITPGGGTETFFTDSHGWVIALATVLREQDGLWIDAAAGLGSTIHEHLEHHHIRERVDLVDVSAAHRHALIAGPAAATWLAARCTAPVPQRLFDHRPTRLGGVEVVLLRIDWCGGDGFAVRCARENADHLHAWLDGEQLPRASAAAVDAARIEARYPLPPDIPPRTLPQELDRTGRAISFAKGCYLGQETVARLDALGHVNRKLVLLATAGTIPPAVGGTVLCDGMPVGTVTSACLSARLGRPIALGLVHRRGWAPDGTLTIDGAACQFVTAGATAAGVSP